MGKREGRTLALRGVIAFLQHQQSTIIILQLRAHIRSRRGVLHITCGKFAARSHLTLGAKWVSPPDCHLCGAPPMGLASNITTTTTLHPSSIPQLQPPVFSLLLLGEIRPRWISGLVR
jgi:hypothetical protein